MVGRFLLISCLWVLLIPSYSQINLREEVPNAILFHANYCGQIPAADLASRFGLNSTVSGGFDYKYKLWLFGAEGNFIFGNKVKEPDIVNQLRDDDGYIVDIEGNPSNVTLFERGWAIRAQVARIVPVGKPNKNSGLKFGIGLGYLEHKILVNANPRLLPQLDKQYRKGYDRLAGGVLLSEFIGYQFFDNRKYINFHVGIELMQAFTQPLRSYNFDTNAPDPIQRRIDLLFGIKVGWIIPIFSKERREKFYTK